MTKSWININEIYPKAKKKKKPFFVLGAKVIIDEAIDEAIEDHRVEMGTSSTCSLFFSLLTIQYPSFTQPFQPFQGNKKFL